MNFELSEEHQMLKDLVARFVRRPVDAAGGRRSGARGQGRRPDHPEEDRLRIDAVSKDLGLWGLDAPEDVGGSDLPSVAMVGVNEELGRTITPTPSRRTRRT